MTRNETLRFRKSSRSGGDNGSQCVAIARTSELAVVRDSKNPDSTLRFPVGALDGLITFSEVDQ